MHSEAAVYAMALLWGVTNSLEDIALGRSSFDVLVKFLGSVLIGTLITMGIVWVVLKVIRKPHLLYAVTNWTLLAFSCVNILFVAMPVPASG